MRRSCWQIGCGLSRGAAERCVAFWGRLYGCGRDWRRHPGAVRLGRAQPIKSGTQKGEDGEENDAKEWTRHGGADWATRSDQSCNGILWCFLGKRLDQNPPPQVGRLHLLKHESDLAITHRAKSGQGDSVSPEAGDDAFNEARPLCVYTKDPKDPPI